MNFGSSGSVPRSEIWLAAAGVFIGVTVSVLLFRRVPAMGVIWFAGSSLLFSLPLLFTLSRNRAAAYQAAQAAAEKPKRGEPLGELMSILNDEDIADLRARVKARLEEQIDHAGADEIETFEDLLAETKEKLK